MGIIDPSSVDAAKNLKKKPKERFQEAESLFKEGRKTEALQILRDLDREFPNQPNLLAAMAVVRKALGHVQDARQLALRLRDEFKDPRGDKLLLHLEQTAKARADALQGEPPSQ
ncbi:MAG: tetratricopeptide repeat protein [Candidatus Hydrogenedentes bacterium]|nr:tetratricopeptide repeat protein [Candidatus Hydrogenedentota bacterium]